MANQNNSRIGCGFIVLVLVLLGLLVEYWYVAVPLLVVVTAVGLLHRSRQKRIQRDSARRRPGPRDPWLNEVAVALADFEFTEFARNAGTQVAGVPIEGDIRLDAARFSVTVTLLETAELAHQAEVALRAKPEVRAAIAEGKTVVRVEGRVLYTAQGRGGVVDEPRLNEVVQIVDGIPIGPPRVPPPVPGPSMSQTPAVRTPPPTKPTPAIAQPAADVLDQIARLAALRDSGALTEAEFAGKKAELLKRL